MFNSGSQRISVSVMFLLCLFNCGFASADDKISVTMTNQQRYIAPLASSAQVPELLMKIPFGEGESEVCGYIQDVDRITNGIPYSFMVLENESAWILDSIAGKLKLFSKNGSLVSKIQLATATDEKITLIADFAQAPQNGFYVYSAFDGLVKRISNAGETIVEIEGLNDSLCIGRDKRGNVLVKNLIKGGLFRFNPSGEIIDLYQGQKDLSVYSDINGLPYGIRGENDTSASLFKSSCASPAAEIQIASFSIGTSTAKDVHIVNRKILGTDALWNIYVEITACDNDGIIHFNKFFKVSPEGKILSSIDFINPKTVISPDLPRHRVVSPQGKIIAFEVTEKYYSLVYYRF
ncbi:MAG: hypothetical protein HQM10_05490 [Candidatus Riflebacteria bacterium]|nr:hypothetical protein [Candidatus Riflebacteria bacterium]